MSDQPARPTKIMKKIPPASNKDARYSCWSVTAFGDEIKLLSCKEVPKYVHKVHGGLELCPETQREHFQGCLELNTRVRMSTLKEWLPTSHLEPALKKEALIAYAMKEDTAIGPKTTRVHSVPYMGFQQAIQNIMTITYDYQIEIREVYNTDRESESPKYKCVEDTQVDYAWKAIKKLIIQNPGTAQCYANPSLMRFLIHTWDAWMQLEHKRRKEESEKLELLAVQTGQGSIVLPPLEFEVPRNEIILASPNINSNAQEILEKDCQQKSVSGCKDSSSEDEG